MLNRSDTTLRGQCFFFRKLILILLRQLKIILRIQCFLKVAVRSLTPLTHLTFVVSLRYRPDTNLISVFLKTVSWFGVCLMSSDLFMNFILVSILFTLLILNVYILVILMRILPSYIAQVKLDLDAILLNVRRNSPVPLVAILPSLLPRIHPIYLVGELRGSASFLVLRRLDLAFEYERLLLKVFLRR